jgi:hypothetical protein
MKTIASYLQSKTVQGILGLLVLGLMKNYHVTILDDQTLSALALLFGTWTGIGLRNAINPIAPAEAPKQ